MKKKREGMSKGKIWFSLILINFIFVSSLTKANTPPVLDPIGPKTVYEFHTLIFGIHATDSDGDSIVLEASNLPANSTFIDSGIFADSLNGSGSFRFRPDDTQAGIYNVTFKAIDPYLACDSEVVQITVINLEPTTIFVSDTITYQGHIQTKVSVYIDNIDQNIEAFELLFSVSSPDRAYFTTDHFEVFIDTVCLGQGRPCHPDSVRIDTTISRVVKIDASGSLTSDFSTLEARGEVGDTNNSYCVNMSVLGLAPDNEPLGPGFGLLFKLYLDVLCLSDTLPLPDTLVYVNVFGTLAQGDTLIKAKKFLPGRLIILGGVKYGDPSGDNKISVSDAIYIIGYLFKGGDPPDPWIEGDANGDGQISVADVIYLVNYLFKGGPPPHCYEVWNPM